MIDAEAKVREGLQDAPLLLLGAVLDPGGQAMTDTNLNEALETHIATVREALEVNLALWRDDVEPGDFDRDVIEPTQRALAALSQIEARLAGLEKELDEQDAAFSKQGGRNSDLVARLAQAEAALRLIADNGATAVVGEIEDMDVWCAQTIGRLKGIARSYFTEEGP